MQALPTYIRKSGLMLFLASALPALLGEQNPPAISIPPGFEIRRLDRFVPLEIKTGATSTRLSCPVWILMPLRGQPQSDIEPLTDSYEFTEGTAVLPAPPQGFSLRALRQSFRETVNLTSGKTVIIDQPIYAYFRRKLHLQNPAPAEKSEMPVLKTGDAFSQAVNDATSSTNIRTASPAENLEKLKLYRLQTLTLKEELQAVAGSLPEGSSKQKLEAAIVKLESFGTHSGNIYNTYETNFDDNTAPNR